MNCFYIINVMFYELGVSQRSKTSDCSSVVSISTGDEHKNYFKK